MPHRFVSQTAGLFLPPKGVQMRWLARRCKLVRDKQVTIELHYRSSMYERMKLVRSGCPKVTRLARQGLLHLQLESVKHRLEIV